MARSDVDEEVIAALSVALPRVSGVQVVPNAPLSKLTPLRVGGPADLLVFVENAEALQQAARLMKRVACPWRVQWPFDPHLPKDGGLAGALVVLGSAFEGLTTGKGGHVVLGAATPFAALAAAGPGFEELARWPGTPGGLLACGHGRLLAGPCAGVTVVSISGTRRRAVPATATPSTPARSSVPLSVELRPVPPAHGPPLAPGQMLEPDGPLADLGGTVRDVERALSDADLMQSRLRGWTLSTAWPGSVVHSGDGTTRDLELLTRALAEKLHRERGMLTRQAPRVWGRPPLSNRPRSRS